MTTHPNDMTAWPTIACQRGHDEHATRQVRVDLRERHGYRDFAQVPEQLAVSFTMTVWDTEQHPVDGGPYCPAHDAVSETILSHRIWEPRETILTLAVLAGASPAQCFVDMGAQIGWYSLLAVASGVETLAVDAEPANLAVLLSSVYANEFPTELRARQVRIGPDEPAWPVDSIRLAKLDLEGAERDGLSLLWPSIAERYVDHLLVEVSPVFKPGDHYPDLVCDLIDAGYEAYRLPPKAIPPVPFYDAEQYVGPHRLDRFDRDLLRRAVAEWHQEDVWFRRKGASW